ncbi:MAG: FAD-binding oxidoreductase [Acidobacteriota bacterium]|nr:FAD-binding oxidoreductase [Acidobacteriota bacterium]
MSDRADVVIVGGGVVGCSAAWHLRQDGFTGRILVVERDPTYQRASSYLAMGGIRQQFCTPVTVQMVQFSVELWKRFDQALGTPAKRPHAWFRQRGYLFLANGATSTALTNRYHEQKQAGASVRMVAVDELQQMLPGVMLDDILFGVLGDQDGYANPREVLAGFRAGAELAGAEFLADEVIAIDREHGAVTGVRLAGGANIAAPVVVNAAGPWAGRLAALAGVTVPVEPLRQMLFRCTLPRPWPSRFPMLIDPGGVHWRHDDATDPGGPDKIILAFTNWHEKPGENLAADDDRWKKDFYPAMVNRAPDLHDVTEVQGWAGLYEMTPDHNPVLGPHPDLAGFIFANGFSGHGLMMSPATGKIVSEFVRLGRSEMFDVGIFAPDRFARGALIHDAATI